MQTSKLWGLKSAAQGQQIYHKPAWCSTTPPCSPLPPELPQQHHKKRKDQSPRAAETTAAAVVQPRSAPSVSGKDAQVAASSTAINRTLVALQPSAGEISSLRICMCLCVCLCVSVCAEVGGRTAKNKDKCFPASTFTQQFSCLGWWPCLHCAPPACPMPPHTWPQCSVPPNPTAEPGQWEAGAALPSLPQHRSSSSWKQNNNNRKEKKYIYIPYLPERPKWMGLSPQQNKQEIKAKVPSKIRPKYMSQLGPSSPGACPDLSAPLALAHLWCPLARGAPAAGGKATQTGLSHQMEAALRGEGRWR